MKDKYYAISAAEFAAGPPRKVVALRELSRDVLVMALDGKYLAFDRRCPHEGRNLDKAMVINGKIICPVHQYAFNASNGSCTNHHCPQLGVYETVEEDGNIYILIDDKSIQHLNPAA